MGVTAPGRRRLARHPAGILPSLTAADLGSGATDPGTHEAVRLPGPALALLSTSRPLRRQVQ
ncbi:hypothetical protein ACIOHO_26375 [Streptomyces sp. NPDC087849]|uniref:hypothetical protein n=1 Tax=Streptomyces sp. NPDC087849 TaxID=3365808 RepID=UPI00380BDF46